MEHSFSTHERGGGGSDRNEVKIAYTGGGVWPLRTYAKPPEGQRMF